MNNNNLGPFNQGINESSVNDVNIKNIDKRIFDINLNIWRCHPSLAPHHRLVKSRLQFQAERKKQYKLENNYTN